MKIIGGRDYYDSGMVYTDNSVRFVRKNLQVAGDFGLPRRRHADCYVTTVHFCGNQYVGVRDGKTWYWTAEHYLEDHPACMDRRSYELLFRPDTFNVHSFMVDNRITIAVWTEQVYSLRYHEHPWTIDGWGLQQMQFYRVKPAFEAYQEIEQWISGTLGEASVKPPQIVDEKIRIAKRGFDPVWSFRKEPTKKK